MTSIRNDNGSTTVLSLVLSTVLIFAFSAIGFGTRVAYDYRLAQQAADLSALAGANVSVDNSGEACDIARQIASSNRAQLLSCTVLIGEVRVTVRSGSLGFVKATAQAGIF